ncbi:hypothetical protein T552_01123 [Pneumocystis carinii B80]|uniref:DUF221-domain-containing protein n=1 Tax=Pneumocystis carinii (strain B80) TaxID=1408658 RepID=A0A0W4ZLB3_PNEC8|nr:hypothetical protein T552_01123 [Pneumocystis carinii B80]KTW29166.1 hypothetical protein T552_01123 [Pneumocystis carinii B80]
MSDTGGIHNLEGTSLPAFITSLSVNFVMFTIQVAGFFILRNFLHRVYEPRSVIKILPSEKKVRSPPRSFLKLFRLLYQTRPEHIIKKSGLDAYFFLRFLRMCIILFTFSLLVIWPILLPINSVDGIDKTYNRKPRGLDKFSFGNISPKHINKYWAHLVLAYLFVCVTCYLIYYELKHFIQIRQAYLSSPQHRNTTSATTVLITTVPDEYLDVGKLKELFSIYPGGVKNVWINRDFSPLLEQIEKRDIISQQLEEAETCLIRNALKSSKKKKIEKEMKKSNYESVQYVDSIEHSKGLVYKYVSYKKRPKHRLPLFSWFISLPLIGKKVDTINWCISELKKLNPEILEQQKHPEKFKQMNSVFIQFNEQISAHLACQNILHHNALHMTPKYLHISPRDIIWDNLQLKWWDRLIRAIIVVICIASLVIFFAFPVAFVGSLSNVISLSKKFSWLEFLGDLSKSVTGLITGLLPSVLLAIIMASVPIIMRFAAELKGLPTQTDVELTVQNMYFSFLVVQVFLVVTISSGITAVIASIINNPQNTPKLLAQNLPRASNFFFSYILLQGLSIASGELLQIITLILYYSFGKLMDNTPRKLWSRFTTLRVLEWGTTFPRFTNLSVIGITYSIIAPLIMVFVIIAFMLFYVVYLYNFLYVFDFPVDTGGLAFPRSLYQMMTGIYLLEACLTGLFFLARDDQNHFATKAQGILMIILIIFTVFYQLLLQKSFDPLIKFLPLTSQDQNSNQDYIHKLFDLYNSNYEDIDYESSIQDVISDGSKSPSNYVDFNTNCENLSIQERESIIFSSFQHKALQTKTPIIWLPQDELGIAKDEIERMPSEILVSMEFAKIDNKGKLTFQSNPPDWDPYSNLAL